MAIMVGGEIFLTLCLHNSLHRCGDSRAISSSFVAAINIAFFPHEAGVTRAARTMGWSNMLLAGWLAC